MLRPLSNNGIDILYVDESARHPRFTATAVRVPFLRHIDSRWRYVWSDYYDNADVWRRQLSRDFGVRFRKELHGYELLKAGGLYLRGKRNFRPDDAVMFYKEALARPTFLEPASIFTVFGFSDSRVAGFAGIEATMVGLLQRLRTQCSSNGVDGLLFFDEGHDEYIRWYRRAQVYLPTGSAYGAWDQGQATKNLPLTMFPKDANFKKSHLSYFLQMADLVVYAARIKLEAEANTLTAKLMRRGHGTVYDSLPTAVLNLKATKKRTDGIVPIEKAPQLLPRWFPRCPAPIPSREDKGS